MKYTSGCHCLSLLRPSLRNHLHLFCGLGKLASLTSTPLHPWKAPFPGSWVPCLCYSHNASWSPGGDSLDVRHCHLPRPGSGRCSAARDVTLSRRADRHQRPQGQHTQGCRKAPARPIRTPSPCQPPQRPEVAKDTRGRLRLLSVLFQQRRAVPCRAVPPGAAPPAAPASRNDPGPAEPYGNRASAPNTCACSGQPLAGPGAGLSPVRRQQPGRAVPSASVRYRVAPSAGAGSRHLPPRRHGSASTAARPAACSPSASHVVRPCPARHAGKCSLRPRLLGAEAAQRDCKGRPVGERTGEGRGNRPVAAAYRRSPGCSNRPAPAAAVRAAPPSRCKGQGAWAAPSSSPHSSVTQSLPYRGAPDPAQLPRKGIFCAPRSLTLYDTSARFRCFLTGSPAAGRTYVCTDIHTYIRNHERR